jgi:hypothetical protein
VTNLLPLWRIEEELEALVNSVDGCPDELRPDLEAKIAEYLSASAEKVDKVDAVLASLDGVAESARREIERLRERQQSAERSSRRLEGYVLRVLRERDGRPLKGRNVTFSARRSEALVIDDPGAVPNEFKRTTITVDVPKDPIKRALKAGQIIPGVHIEQHENLHRK